MVYQSKEEEEEGQAVIAVELADPTERSTTLIMSSGDHDVFSSTVNKAVNHDASASVGDFQCSGMDSVQFTVTNEPAKCLGQNGTAKKMTVPCSKEGPDGLEPTDDLVTWSRHGAVKLQMTEEGTHSQTPISVMSLMRQTVKKYPDRVALGLEVDGKWEDVTYTQYYAFVIQAAKSFIKLGLEVRQSVGIIGFNSPQWFIAHLATIFAGGLSTGIYATNSAEACAEISNSAECNMIIVENEAQLRKIVKVRDQLTHLKAIIQYKGQPTDPSVYSWDQFLALGENVSDEELEERVRLQAPNKCCTLIYTSGTTGRAKAVMLSHDNLTWTARRAGLLYHNWGDDGLERIVSYLPLSHVAALVTDLYVMLWIGGATYFARPDAMKGSLGETLRAINPTIFLGVPRVYEKFQEKMMDVGKSQSTITRYIAAWAKDIGHRGNIALMKNEPLPWGWTIARWLVFSKVRAALGLDKAQWVVSSAAPLPDATYNFFLGLDIPLLQVFGISECSGPHTLTTGEASRLNSVGKEIARHTTKIVDPDSDGSGELCVQGRNRFMGYMNDEAMTRSSIDEDGWFHTGDLGRIDEDEFIYVTGRIKELLITAGGENVAPVPIEDRVKRELPCISNCMLVGDRRRFISLLVTLKTVIDACTNEPINDLAPSVIDWCKTIGSDAMTVSDILEKKDARVFEAIERGIVRVNSDAISRAQNIQKWTLLPTDFSISGGELGPTMKLKRHAVCVKYEKTIDSLYDCTGDS